MSAHVEDPGGLLDADTLAGLAEPVREFITRARWFGGRERTVASVRLDDHAVLREGEPQVLFTVWRVTYATGPDERYAILLAVRRMPTEISGWGPDHLVSATAAPGLVVYDALAEPQTASELWRTLAEERTVATAHGRLTGHCDQPVDLDDLDEIVMLGLEQSNTALSRAHREFLKWVRRVEPGPSVELEMTGALAATGFAQAPRRLATLTYGREGEEPTMLALLQQYLHSGSEGWALALTSLRDLYAEAEEHEDNTPFERQEAVENQGASFVDDAARLGDATASMHLAMTDPTIPAELAPTPVTERMLNLWADAMTGELDRLLASENPAIAPLRERRDLIASRYEALRGLSDGGLAIRIHGDFHLGQVMRTNDGWYILDFGGEPARPAEERREQSTPLRDVAGMLRSFDYAAAAALAERTSPVDPQWPALYAQGDAWANANREAFWAAYLRRVEGTPLLPSDGGALVLRRAFELSKAVYEVGYELGHRPEWVGIPLHFLLAGSA